MTAAAAATSPRRRRVAAVVVAVAGALLGVVAEQATRVTDVAVWVPDLAVGWTFLLGGVLGWYRRPSSRTGLLLAGTGLALWRAGSSLEI